MPTRPLPALRAPTKQSKARNSELDRRLNCPGSFADDGALLYDEPNEMARTGTAGHYALAICVGDDFANPVGAAAQAADRYGVDFDDLRRIVFQGRDVWDDVKSHFPSPQAEHRVEGRVSRGTSDVANISSELAVLDWKTGYAMVEHPNQLHGYADGLVQQYGMPARGYVLGIEAWVRHGTLRVHKITQERLDQFCEDVERANQKDTFAAGAWCTYCPRRNNCEARMQLARTSVDVLMVDRADGAIALTPADIGAAWERKGLIKKAIDDLDKLAKQLLREGVEIPLPDGRRLGLTDIARRSIGAHAAYDVLTGEGFDMSHGDALDALGNAQSKSINTMVGEHAADGEKGRDRARAMDAIDAAGGVTVKMSQRFTILDAGDSDD